VRKWSWAEAVEATRAHGFFVGQSSPGDPASSLPPGLSQVGQQQVLRPREPHDGRRGTFSAMHGFGQFPWHTDGAIADHPPRFILLSSVESAATPTELLFIDASSELMRALRPLVLYRRWVQPRYLRAVDVVRGQERVRWDPDKLDLASPSPGEISLDGQAPTHAVEWRSGTTTLIDNWRCLHRRPGLRRGDTARALTRTYIQEEVEHVRL